MAIQFPFSKQPNMTEPIQSEEPRVKKALKYIKSMLIPGETLESWAIQRRLFALTHPRRCAPLRDHNKQKRRACGRGLCRLSLRLI